MTPLHIEILLHYNRTSEPFHSPTTVANDYSLYLSEVGMLYRTEENNFHITEGGRMLVNRLCNTPFPVEGWVWDDGYQN